MESGCKKANECFLGHGLSLNGLLVRQESMAANARAHFTSPGECNSYLSPKTTSWD